MPKSPTQSPARVFRRLLEILAGLLPAVPVAYLYVFQSPDLCVENHEFHEAAIALALVEGVFISWVSWRCYLHSGEVFVKWLALGFTGFTVVYSPHGVFTPVAHQNIWLFLLYGPASRLLMTSCVFIGLLKSGGVPDKPEVRENSRYWASWFGFFIAINIAVAILANSAIAGAPWVRFGQEIASIALCLAALSIISWRGYRSPLMVFYGLALSWFAISSAAFMLASPWNHMWWLAHGIFAGGFSILGYGVLRAYLSNQSFEKVFVEKELFEDLAETNARLQDSADRLRESNRQLERQIQASEVAREQFSTLFKVSPDGIIVVEPGGSIVKANPGAEQMFGYGQGGLEGLMVEELMPQEARGEHARTRKLYEHSPATRPMGALSTPLVCLRKDGSSFRAAISISGLVFEGRQCMVTFIRDVTYLLESDKRQELADRAAIEKGLFLGWVVAQVPGLVFQFRRKADGSYDLPFVGPKAGEILGLDAEQLMAEGARLLFSRVHPADLAALITTIEQAAASFTPWQAGWRSHHPEKGMQPFWATTSLPKHQADGSVFWSGYLRCVRERQDDAAEAR